MFPSHHPSVTFPFSSIISRCFFLKIQYWPWALSFKIVWEFFLCTSVWRSTMQWMEKICSREFLWASRISLRFCECVSNNSINIACIVLVSWMPILVVSSSINRIQGDGFWHLIKFCEKQARMGFKVQYPVHLLEMDPSPKTHSELLFGKQKIKSPPELLKVHGPWKKQLKKSAVSWNFPHSITRQYSSIRGWGGANPEDPSPKIVAQNAKKRQQIR